MLSRNDSSPIDLSFCLDDYIGDATPNFKLCDEIQLSCLEINHY